MVFSAVRTILFSFLSNIYLIAFVFLLLINTYFFLLINLKILYEKTNLPSRPAVISLPGDIRSTAQSQRKTSDGSFGESR